MFHVKRINISSAFYTSKNTWKESKENFCVRKNFHSKKILASRRGYFTIFFSLVVNNYSTTRVIKFPRISKKKHSSEAARIIVTQGKQIYWLSTRIPIKYRFNPNARWKVHLRPRLRNFARLRVFRIGTSSISEARRRLANDSEPETELSNENFQSAMQMIKLRSEIS